MTYIRSLPTLALPRRGVPRSAAVRAARSAVRAVRAAKASSTTAKSAKSANEPHKSSAERFRRKVAQRHTRLREIHSGLVKSGRDAHSQLVEFARLERKGEPAATAADTAKTHSQTQTQPVEAELLDDDTLLDTAASAPEGFDLDEE